MPSRGVRRRVWLGKCMLIVCNSVFFGTGTHTRSCLFLSPCIYSRQTCHVFPGASQAITMGNNPSRPTGTRREASTTEPTHVRSCAPIFFFRHDETKDDFMILICERRRERQKIQVLFSHSSSTQQTNSCSSRPQRSEGF